jgi:hypothetical protein
MWARVRGETENAVLRLPFRTAVVIRPAGIIPLHGITSRTPLYRAAYAITRPICSPVQATRSPSRSSIAGG